MWGYIPFVYLLIRSMDNWYNYLKVKDDYKEVRPHIFSDFASFFSFVKKYKYILLLHLIFMTLDGFVKSEIISKMWSYYSFLVKLGIYSIEDARSYNSLINISLEPNVYRILLSSRIIKNVKFYIVSLLNFWNVGIMTHHVIHNNIYSGPRFL